MKNPTFKKTFKSVAKGTTKVLKAAKTATVVARPLLKYKNEIETGLKYGAKAGKFLVNNSDTIQKIYKAGSKYATSGKSFSVPGVIADATIGYAKRKGEKYLDKKLGKYQAYRIAKNGLDLAYDVSTGNPMAAIKHGTNLYAELDPNKKRAAKVAGAIRGTTGVLSSVATGNVKGAFDNGLSLYSLADKNKKRVGRVNDINQHYIQPTYGVVDSGIKLDAELNRKSFH